MEHLKKTEKSTGTLRQVRVFCTMILGADKVYFVTSVEEERADAALDGMFKFLAAQENDTIRDRTIRQVEFLKLPVFWIFASEFLTPNLDLGRPRCSRHYLRVPQLL
jgi:hypothetical protein